MALHPKHLLHSLLFLAAIAAVTTHSDAHGPGHDHARAHSHDSHAHSHTHSKKGPRSAPSFSFKLPDSPYVDTALRYLARVQTAIDNNPFPHLAQQLSNRLTELLRPLHDLPVKQAAVTASLLTSSVSLVAVVLLPFSALLTTLLLPFAAGALLSDLAYHLLPHLYEMRPPPSPLALLLSVALFAALDAVLRRTTLAAAVATTHMHPGGAHAYDSNAVVLGGTTTTTLHSASTEYGSGGPVDVATITNTSTTGDIGEVVSVAAYINLAADALHNFCDGLSLAAAFSASPAAGIATTIAIILHELPQELADFALLLRAGFGTRRAILANVLCALTALAGTLVALHAADLVQGADAYILPFAAGALMYLTFATVIPDVVSDLVAPVSRQLAGKVLHTPVSFLRFVLRLFVASLSAAAGVAIVALVESLHTH